MIFFAKMPRYYPTYFEENSESLALGYLASHLRNNGYKVKIFDASLEGLSLEKAKNSLLQYCNTYHAFLIGFTISDMTYIESTVEAIDFLRNKGIQAHITMGGHSPTFNYKEIFQMCNGLDSIIRYEGEIPLKKLADALARKKDWHDIPNIAYRRNKERIIANSPLPLIKDLDSLPFPARDYLPLVINRLNPIGIVPLSASRGCYMDCGFCSIRQFYGPPEGSLWRTRSIDNIISEIKSIKKKEPKVKEVVFVDDIFSGPPKNRIKRMEELRDKLKDNNLHIMLSISDRADAITEEIGEIWREMGVRQILLGFESASPEVLKIMNKGITLEDQKHALRVVRGNDIDEAISYINFTPWSTLEQIEENVRYFLSLKINMLQGMLNRFQIYDGTPLTERLKKEGLVYGKFPNEHYHTPDKRVDKLYDIINKSFNPYLFVAYRLKVLERELRIALFDAETDKNRYLETQIREYRVMYREMLQRIMEEASARFLEVLELVKNGVPIDKYFHEEIKEKVLIKSNEWFKMMEIFRALCPVLNLTREKGGIYVRTAKIAGE